MRIVLTICSLVKQGVSSVPRHCGVSIVMGWTREAVCTGGNVTVTVTVTGIDGLLLVCHFDPLSDGLLISFLHPQQCANYTS